jgi:hypothetical protein
VDINTAVGATLPTVNGGNLCSGAADNMLAFPHPIAGHADHGLVQARPRILPENMASP